jgi:hypothetical protein
MSQCFVIIWWESAQESVENAEEMWYIGYHKARCDRGGLTG